ncbi:MAG TPA: FAD/NAD(P)-binding protein, partial [Edaphobacter sp.]|nr:FAD/NAD(P)-binding protein [Edaphobacter sp.]
MKSRITTRKTIAIIGGGVSGSLTAFHLIHQGANARVIVIEPRPELGLGLAYSTPSLRHLLNVPAGKISALPNEPEHFLRWLRTHQDPHATEATFAPRAVFGRYIRSLLARTTGIEQIQATVIDYRPFNAGAVLTLDNGTEVKADMVVLATGNFDPAELPGISPEAKASGAYCHNAWLPETYKNLAPDAPIALIGTGLTGVDVLLRLRELGHTGTITAVSRHGVFPNRHAGYTPMQQSAIPADSAPTCVAYLRALRAVIRNGVEWRAAIDSLRATTNDLWLALPLKEQRRFRRHLQRRWDVVRHRMAPPIADIIEAELASGTLVIHEGSLQSIEAADNG